MSALYTLANHRAVSGHMHVSSSNKHDTLGCRSPSSSSHPRRAPPLESTAQDTVVRQNKHRVSLQALQHFHLREPSSLFEKRALGPFSDWNLVPDLLDVGEAGSFDTSLGFEDGVHRLTHLLGGALPKVVLGGGERVFGESSVVAIRPVVVISLVRNQEERYKPSTLSFH